jgi:hypothetical protein
VERSDLRIGVSRLADGTRVLTPFGRLGGVYQFDRIRAWRLEVLTAALLWTGAVGAIVFIGAGALRGLNPGQTFGGLLLALVGLDAIRIPLTKLLFLTARHFMPGSRERFAGASDAATRFLRLTLVPTLLLEASLFGLGCARMVSGAIGAVLPCAVTLCYALIYANRRLDAAASSQNL